MALARCALPRSLEEILDPGKAAGKYAPLHLRRLAMVLAKYAELDKASKFHAMHKSRQAEVSARSDSSVAVWTHVVCRGTRRHLLSWKHSRYRIKKGAND